MQKVLPGTQCFSGDQVVSATLTYFDSPFTALHGSGDRAASAGIRFDVTEAIPGADWTLDEALDVASPGGALGVFQNGALGNVVVNDGAVGNVIEFWSAGAPGWYGATQQGRVAFHYRGVVRPADNRSWFNGGASFPLTLALGGNGYFRVDIGGVNVWKGSFTEAMYLEQGLLVLDPATVTTGTQVDIYYVQRDEDRWGGLVVKALGLDLTNLVQDQKDFLVREAPVLGCGLIDMGLPVVPKVVRFWQQAKVMREVGKAGEGSLRLPLLNPQVHDGSGWVQRRAAGNPQDPGHLHYFEGGDPLKEFDLKRHRLITIEATVEPETWPVFTGFIEDFKGLSRGTAEVPLVDFTQRMIRRHDKNFPDRIDYMAFNYKRRLGATEPTYDVPAFDNWPLEHAIAALVYRSHIDASRLRAPLTVPLADGTEVPVVIQGLQWGTEAFRKFRARAMNGKPIRLTRSVHYGNYGSAFTELRPVDDPYVFPTEPTQEAWARASALCDKYGYDVGFDEHGDMFLRAVNNPAAVANIEVSDCSGAVRGTAPEAYAGTFVHFAGGGTATKTVTGARIDVAVGRNVGYGTVAYTVAKASAPGVILSSGSFATGTFREEFFYNYRAATDGVNSTVGRLHSGDYDTYVVNFTLSGTVRLDALLLYHTDPDKPKLPQSLRTDKNAVSVTQADSMDEMRNFCIVVGRRKAAVTDSDKLERNPHNPEPEFVVAVAVDKDSILNRNALHYIGHINETIIYSDGITDDDFAGYVARVFIYRYRNPRPGALADHTLLPFIQLRDPFYAVETRYQSVTADWVLYAQRVVHTMGDKSWRTEVDGVSWPPYPSYEPRNDIDIDQTFSGAPVIDVQVSYLGLSNSPWLNPAGNSIFVARDTKFDPAAPNGNGVLVETTAVAVGGEQLSLAGYPWPPVPGTVQIRPVIGNPALTGDLKLNADLINDQRMKPGSQITPDYVMVNFGGIAEVKLQAVRRLATITTTLGVWNLTTNPDDNPYGFYFHLVGDGRNRRVAVKRSNTPKQVLRDARGNPSPLEDLVFVDVNLKWYQARAQAVDEWVTNTPYHHFFDVDYAGRKLNLVWKQGDGGSPYARNSGITQYLVRYRSLGPVDGSNNFSDPYPDGSPFYDPYTSELGNLVKIQADFLVSGYYNVSIRSAHDPNVVIAYLTEPAVDDVNSEAHWAFFQAGSRKTFFWDGVDTVGQWNFIQSEDYANAAHSAFQQDQKPKIGKNFYAWNRERDGGELAPMALVDGSLTGNRPVWGAGAQGTYASWFVHFQAKNDELEEVAQKPGGRQVPRVTDSRRLLPEFQTNAEGSTTDAYVHTHLPDPTRLTLEVSDWPSATLLDEGSLDGTNPESLLSATWVPNMATGSADYGWVNNWKPVRVRFRAVQRPGTLWALDGAMEEASVKINRVAHYKYLIHDQFEVFDGVAYPDSRTEQRQIVSRRLCGDGNTFEFKDANARKAKSFASDTNPEGAVWYFQPKQCKKDWTGEGEQPVDFMNYTQVEEVPKWDAAREVGGPRSRLNVAFMAQVFYLSVYTQDRSGRFSWAINPEFVDRSKIVANTAPVAWPEDSLRQHRRTIITRQWRKERLSRYQTWAEFQTARWGLSGVGSQLLEHQWKDHDPASATLNGTSWPSLATDLWTQSHLSALGPLGFTGASLTRQLEDGDLGAWSFESDPLWYPCVTRDFFPYSLVPPMFDNAFADRAARTQAFYASVDVSPYNSDKQTGSDVAKGDVWSSGVWDMTDGDSLHHKFFPGTKIQPKNPPVDNNAIAANMADYTRQDDTCHWEEYRGVFSRGPRAGEQPKKVSPILPYYVNTMRLRSMSTVQAKKNPAYPKMLVAASNYFSMRVRGEYVWESGSMFPTDQYGVELPSLYNHERCRFQQSGQVIGNSRFDTGAWVGWKDDLAAFDPLWFKIDTSSLLTLGLNGGGNVFDSGYMPVALGPEGGYSQEVYFHLVLLNERREQPVDTTEVVPPVGGVAGIQWNPASAAASAGSVVYAVPTLRDAGLQIITGGRFTYSNSDPTVCDVYEGGTAYEGVLIVLKKPGTATITASNSGYSGTFVVTST